jgi:hypothetical protein
MDYRDSAGLDSSGSGSNESIVERMKRRRVAVEAAGERAHGHEDEDEELGEEDNEEEEGEGGGGRGARKVSALDDVPRYPVQEMGSRSKIR